MTLVRVQETRQAQGWSLQAPAGDGAAEKGKPQRVSTRCLGCCLVPEEKDRRGKVELFGLELRTSAMEPAGKSLPFLLSRTML